MAKIAVDVVLLPSDDMMDKAIDINRRLAEVSGSELRLNKTEYLPHITLAMGCVEEEHIGEIDKLLEGFAKEFEIFHLRTIPSQEKRAWIRIRKNDKLQLLHESIMNKLKAFFTCNAAENMLFKYKEEKIRGVTLEYIKQFLNESSFENYTPHITVGAGNAEILLPEMEFISSELALCHLGNYCTCRKIISSHRLKDRQKESI